MEKDLEYRELIFPVKSNPSSFIINNFDKIEAYKLVSAIIPISCYTISSNNNLLKFRESSATATALSTTLTSCNYSPSTLVTELNTKLNASGGQTSYSCSYATNTNKITISATSNFRFEDNTTTGKCAWYELGFTEGEATAYTNSLVLPNVVDLSGIKAINISSGNLTSKTKVYGSNRNIIASIPIDANIGTVLAYNNTQTEYIDISETDLNVVDLVLQDENMNVINFNGKTVILKFGFLCR